ncbi:MAG: error-prone DNA polymerase [Bdellovibrionia bacterium]
MGTLIKQISHLGYYHSGRSPVRSTLPPEEIKTAATNFSYVELLARSNFSFLQGASHPEELVEEAIRLNYDGIAISDLDGLYGVVRGFQTAQSPSLFTASLKPKDSFKYACGVEFNLIEDISVVLMPTSLLGYQKLCSLITLGKRNVPKGHSKISLLEVCSHNQDLLCFAIPPWNRDHLETLRNSFTDRLYLPMWRDYTWESREFNLDGFNLEQEGFQLFATQRVFMHNSERKALFDVQTCILHQTQITEAKTILISNGERSLKPLEELFAIWKDRPDLLLKTVSIAERIQFSLAELKYTYPQAQTPPNLDSKSYLKELTQIGAQKRFPQGIPQKVQSQIEHELKLINELDYEDYFLTLFEICQYAKLNNILFQGRGSAANSVVCFCLGLTAVNPMEVDLLFERFLSRERGEPPDIDIDFEHERREEVIQYIYEHFTPQHAAMVCTVIRYRSRMAYREVAKVFGLKKETIDSIIKYMGRDGMKRLFEEGAAEKFGVPTHDWELILSLSSALHGFPRHLGIHTGGFLITRNPICEIVPVEKATMNGRYVIQWNKDDIDFLKMMKIDVLSLGMLTCIRKSFDLLRKHKNLDLELYSLPANDHKTYDMICRADTVGVFQIESRAQMNTLPKMRPRNFYDLVIEIALIRPGPLQGGMVHPFLKRRQGLEKVHYPHPDLKVVLEKTLGVPIFQEQVMKIAIVAAGFTPGEADELRRIMSSAWRKKVTMEGVKKRIFSGLKKHGISETYAEQIYKVLEGFSNYGFPESHAASFAHFTYASCWLKAHHPEVFTCALLNSQPMGFYAPRTLIADLQRHGIQVLPLDINSSEVDYTLEEGCLRVGFKSLYGINKQLLVDLISERQKNGSFIDLKDLVQRVSWPKSALLKLAASGALCQFSSTPRHLIWEIESLCLDRQSFIFGASASLTHSTANQDTDSEAIPFESNWQSLQREYSSHGFSVHQHPMGVLRSYLNLKNEHFQKQGWLPYSNSQLLQKFQHKSRVRLAGLLSVTQRPPTAKGMCFLTLEDEFGFMNIIVPPDVYQKNRVAIYQNSILEIQGYLERAGPLLNIKALNVIGIS